MKLHFFTNHINLVVITVIARSCLFDPNTVHYQNTVVDNFNYYQVTVFYG